MSQQASSDWLTPSSTHRRNRSHRRRERHSAKSNSSSNGANQDAVVVPPSIQTGPVVSVDVARNITEPECRVDEVLWIPKEILVGKPHTGWKKRTKNEARSLRPALTPELQQDRTNATTTNPRAPVERVANKEEDEEKEEAGLEAVSLHGLASHVVEDNQCCEKIDEILLEPLTRWLQSLCDETNVSTPSNAQQQPNKAAPLVKHDGKRTLTRDVVMVSMRSKQSVRNDQGHSVRVALRRDIFKNLENAGLTKPSSTSNTDPIVMLPSWIYDDDTVDSDDADNDGVDDDTEDSDDNDNDGVGGCRTEMNFKQQNVDVDDLMKGRSKMRHSEKGNKGREPKTEMETNKHSSHSVVHVARKVAKATSSKNVESAPTTSDTEEENVVSRATEPPKKQCGLGLYVALLVVVSVLFVAGAFFRRHREAKKFTSSQVFASIEIDAVDDDQFQDFDPDSKNGDDSTGNDNSTTLAPSMDGSVNDETKSGSTQDDDSDFAEESPAPSLIPTEADSKGYDYTTTLAPSLGGSVDDKTTKSPSEADAYDVADESPAPSPNPTNALPEIKTVIFAAIGDVPYSDWEAKKLKTQMDALDETAEFVFHVGDIRSGANNDDCHLSEFKAVAEILLRSPVPVFIIPGDNDWLDCKNQADGTVYWNDLFLSFENNWDHGFNVKRDPTMPQNFAFVHRSVLFLAVDLPNVGRNYPTNWDGFLQTIMGWARAVILDYDKEMNGAVGRIVIFSHAMPNGENDAFYDAMQELFNYELNKWHPVLFINGDGHFWEYEDSFRGERKFLRLQVRGEAAEDPTIIRVVATGDHQDVSEAFEYHRGYGSFGPVVAFSAVGTFFLCLTGKLLHKNTRKTATATQ